MKQNDGERKCRRRKEHIVEEIKISEIDSEYERQEKKRYWKKIWRKQRKRTHLAKGNIDRRLKKTKPMDDDRYDVNPKALFPGRNYHCPEFPVILGLAILEIIKILF